MSMGEGVPALSCELHFWAQLGSTAFPETGRLGFLERDLARRPTCRAGINVSAWGNKCLFSISVFSKSRFGTKAVTGSYRTAERGYRVWLDSFDGEVARKGMWESSVRFCAYAGSLGGKSESVGYKHSVVGQRTHVLIFVSHHKQ